MSAPEAIPIPASEAVGVLARVEAVAHLGSWRFDVQPGTVMVSEEALRILGLDKLPSAEAGWDEVARCVHAADRRILEETFAAALRGVRVGAIEFRITQADGIVRWIRGDAESEVDEGGRLVALTGFVQDVTARRVADEPNRQTLDRLLEGATLFDRDWRYAYINETAARQERLERSDTIGCSLLEVNPGIEATEYFARCSECMDQRVAQQFEAPLTFADGTTTWRRISVEPVSDGILVLSLDITDQRALEALAATADRRLRATLQTMDRLAVIIDPAGRVTFCNEPALALTGWTSEEVIGRDAFAAFLPPETRDEVRGLLLGLTTGGVIPSHLQTEVITRAGVRRTIAFTNTVLRDALGGIDGLTAIGEDVTERASAEAALRANEERLRRTMEGIGAVITVQEHLGGPIRINPQVESMLGYPRETVETFAAWNSLVHPDDLGACRAAWTADLADWQLEYRMRRADGRWIWVHDRGRRMPHSDGSAPGMFGVVVEVTSQHEAEARVRASEARFRAVFEESPEAITICRPILDAEGRLLDAEILLANRSARIVLGGMDPEQVAGARMFSDPSRPLAVLFGPAAGVVETGTPWQGEIHDGRAVADAWFDVSIFPFEEGLVLAGRDITERKIAEDAARVANTRLRRFFDANIIGTLVAEPGGRVLDANDYWLGLVGFTRDELERGEIDWRAITPAGSIAADELAISRIREHGSSPSFEKDYLRRDGTRVPVLEVGAAMPGPGDQIASLVLDMTERRDAAAGMARLVAAIEQTSESIVVTDVDATIRYVNPAFERVSGYSFAEVLGQNPRFLHGGTHPQAFFDSMWATLLAGNTWRGELHNRRKDGSPFTEDASISPIRDGDGAITAYVGVKRDITAELQRADELNRARRLEAVGQLAGGIAHDFNNLLSAIQGFGEFVQEALPVGSDTRHDMDEVLRAAERAATLTRQLLMFSRGQRIAPREIRPTEVIDETAAMLRRLVGEHIELVVTHGGDVGSVLANPGSLEQVIVNLTVNARDAMPGGGRIDIRTERVLRPRPDADGGPEVVRITVADTGSGMDEATRDRIFDPFFTTKEPGRGTGLGLATVHGIVATAGGRISVSSEPGRGSSFVVDLPAWIDEATEGAVAPLSPAPANGCETVLVVEDEAALRAVLVRRLRALGYAVIEAASGTEALAIADVARMQIDALVTDVRMPGVQGPELARRLREGRPDLALIFVSGYAASFTPPIAGERAARMLTKPFSMDELARSVRDALDGI